MKFSLFDIENWREIVQTLSQNKTRTFLTGFGIFWGTAILALLLGGSDGLKHLMARNFEGFATNAAAIFPDKTTKSYAGFNKGMELQLDIQDLANIRQAIPQLDAMSPVNFMGALFLYNDKKASGQVMGVKPEYCRIFEPIIYEGRFLNDADEANVSKVCVIGKQVSNSLFGSGSPMGKYIKINDIYYKVVGLVGQTSNINIGGSMDESVFIPSSSMRLNYNQGTRVHIIMMTIKPGYRPGQFENQLRRIIASNHPVAPDDRGAFYYFDISEQFAMVDGLFMGITLLALFVGIGTLLSGIIGVGNIMWIIVRERTHEIGIRRALGAKPRDIIMQILSESMVLTSVAGIAGIAFAVICLAVAQHNFLVDGKEVEFQLTFSNAVGILSTFLILGTAAGIIPALKAMKIKPIEALNDK